MDGHYLAKATPVDLWLATIHLRKITITPKAHPDYPDTARLNLLEDSNATHNMATFSGAG
jgi:hypothetical protein